MITVVNTTTGEVLFQSKDQVSIGVKVNDRDRAVVTTNSDEVAVYLRDLASDRADIAFKRSAYGFWVRMGV
jgi:hypothetical protein